MQVIFNFSENIYFFVAKLMNEIIFLTHIRLFTFNIVFDKQISYEKKTIPNSKPLFIFF